MAGVALLALVLFPGLPGWLDLAAEASATIVLTYLFYAYQSRRFVDFDAHAAKP